MECQTYFYLFAQKEAKANLKQINPLPVLKETEVENHKSHFMRRRESELLKTDLKSIQKDEEFQLSFCNCGSAMFIILRKSCSR